MVDVVRQEESYERLAEVILYRHGGVLGSVGLCAVLSLLTTNSGLLQTSVLSVAICQQYNVNIREVFLFGITLLNK